MVSVTPARFVCVLASVYLMAVLYARNVGASDPGSWFFDPRTAYGARYSNKRRTQAENFILAANASTSSRPVGNHWAVRAPRMCIDILSVAREPRDL